MGVEKVRNYLKEFGLEDRVLEFDKSSATVEEAAIAVGCQPAHIAKTMSFLQKEGPILVVLAGDIRLNNQKYKKNFKQKAKMIPFDEVEGYIGHPPGGVCPFALPEGVKVYLDLSLKQYETVYPAAGTGNSAVRLSPEELQKACPGAEWIDLGKEPDK